MQTDENRAREEIVDTLRAIALSSPKRILAIKAAPEGEFAFLLGLVQEVCPEAEIVSLVSGEEAGAAEEVGEVLRPGMGWRRLWRRLRGGFDVCIAAVGRQGAGGKRKFAIDFLAAAARTKQKIVLCRGRIVQRKRGGLIHLDPILSALRWLAGAAVSLICGAAVVLVFLILAVMVDCFAGSQQKRSG